MRSNVTAIQWNAIYKSKQWNADTQDIVTVNQSASMTAIKSFKEKPWEDKTLQDKNSEYTPTIFRTIQALAIASYVYSLQLVTGDINRRAVSPTGLLN